MTNQPGMSVWDCAIIGGGPAGLTAAIYLARFHLSVTVLDDNTSRAAMIPISHNHAGFPDGISGPDLLARMKAQAQRYGAAVINRKVAGVRKCDDLFTLKYEGGPLSARTVLMATGVLNRRPLMLSAAHDEAVTRGLLRYCPVCDGFEVSDKSVGVLGTGTKGFKEAKFLRSYTRDVTLVAPAAEHDLSHGERRELENLGVKVAEGPVTTIEPDGALITVKTTARSYAFASLYPALGSDIRSSLAVSLGAQISAQGCIDVDAHQRTSVAGLYAAGDVVIGLDQISHAMGQAGVAATAIRNDLCEIEPLVR